MSGGSRCLVIAAFDCIKKRGIRPFSTGLTGVTEARFVRSDRLVRSARLLTRCKPRRLEAAELGGGLGEVEELQRHPVPVGGGLELCQNGEEAELQAVQEDRPARQVELAE